MLTGSRWAHPLYALHFHAIEEGLRIMPAIDRIDHHESLSLRETGTGYAKINLRAALNLIA